MTAPSASTATPMPDGDEMAASSACRRSPPGVNSEPPADVHSETVRPARTPSTPVTSIHPRGRPASVTTSTHSPCSSRRAGNSFSVGRPDRCAAEPRLRSGTTAPGIRDRVRQTRRRNPWPARPARRRGASYCCSRPPGPKTAMWSPSLTASSMSWVTKTIVLLQFGLQALHFGLQVLADHRIDGAEGFVHQQDRRIGSQRPRDPDTLLLPAGQLRRDSGSPAPDRDPRVRAPPTRPCGRRGGIRRAAPERLRRCRPRCGAAAVRRSG